MSACHVRSPWAKTWTGTSVLTHLVWSSTSRTTDRNLTWETGLLTSQSALRGFLPVPPCDRLGTSCKLGNGCTVGFGALRTLHCVALLLLSAPTSGQAGTRMLLPIPEFLPGLALNVPIGQCHFGSMLQAIGQS